MVLLLGALCGAAGLIAQPLPRPASYRPVSAMQMMDTMQGRKNLIEWTCYTEHNGTKPTSRTTAWLEATIKRAPGTSPGLDLWDIGAQHRTAKIKLRVSARNGTPVPVVQVTDAAGTQVGASQQPQPDINGFYTIEPNKGNAAHCEYRIQSNESKLTIEAYYAAHPPPGGFLAVMGFFQTEDGGPPSLPPVNEN